MFIVFFFTGVSTEFMFILLINVSINNFAKEHTGKLIGIYTGIGALGKAFYAGSIELFFGDDLAGYFLSVSIIWVVVFGACVLLHRKRGIRDPALVEDDELKEPLGTTESVDVEDNESVSVREMFRSPHFHLIFLSYFVMVGCTFAFMTNLTTIGESAGMEKPETPYLHTVHMYISLSSVIGCIVG